jgi:hypothetical protein
MMFLIGLIAGIVVGSIGGGLFIFFVLSRESKQEIEARTLS